MQTSLLKNPISTVDTAANVAKQKIFIIGLPRTGTTSISVAMLELGFKVAHTAFTKHTFELADVISDAPCFSDYQQLDTLFPGSKFIYLERELSQWIPSMQRLLVKMAPHLLTKTGHFSPVLKRALNISFGEDHQLRGSEKHLTECYLCHQKQVHQYFEGSKNLLTINLSHENSYIELCTFLSLDYKDGTKFPHLNKGAQVANWKAYKHTNKVSSFSAGKEHRQFFDYINND
ncbi:sulfotransferase family protein [Psychromonas arctica]|uniref:sulfotransferase family protein n=1 Tax=Psychromonas arctica TaxID=168275 RepID=UPI0004129A53|nr:sulfotransferase family protein [Psychromonas arctica]